MAKGNWKPSVIKPRIRCRLCGAVMEGKKVKWVYINKCNPAHKECAERKGYAYTEEMIKANQ